MTSITSIFSSISGQFSKSLILGTLLPTALFVILSQVFLAPLLPSDWLLLEPLETLDPQWRVVAILLLVVVLSGLLYNLNVPIIRFYEGYPWRNTQIGKWRTRHYQEQLDAINARWKGMRTLRYALTRSRTNEERISEIIPEWTKMGQIVNSESPSRGLVLPTRLGNVVRSFEDYPSRQYSIAAITLWPRLVGKIDKDYATTIDDAKTSFDFMINSSVLSAGMALAILLAGLFNPTPLTSPQLWLPWLVEILVFGVLSYIFYLGAIDRASAWGTTVKGAFDLYRWDLLKQLGYKRVPTTMAEERALWSRISQQMIYGDSPVVPLAEYEATPTSASGEPYQVNLETSRGVSSAGDGGPITITICVKNADVQKRLAQKVVVADRLPDGFDYEWNSAHMDNHGIPVVGANPYRFYIGNLDPGKEAVLTYRAILRK